MGRPEPKALSRATEEAGERGDLPEPANDLVHPVDHPLACLLSSLLLLPEAADRIARLVGSPFGRPGLH